MVSCLLLVDDDEVNNFIVEDLIKNHCLSSKTVVCHDGQEALDYLTALLPQPGPGTWPEVILLDMNMPILDGLGFLREYQLLVRPDNKPNVCIMVTTELQIDVDIYVESLLDVVSCKLPKPLTLEGLKKITA